MGDSPLHAACCFGSLDVVRFWVVKKEYNVDKKVGTGRAPIHIATEKEHAEVVQFLLGRKIARSGHFKVAKTLVSCGVFETRAVKNEAGRTPLHEVCFSKSLDALSVLLDIGLFDCNDREWRYSPSCCMLG